MNANTKMLKFFYTNNSSFPAFAFPGAYPIVYVDEEGNFLCADCANENTEDYQEPIADFFIHYEGLPIICEDCNKPIESAYGPALGEELP